MSAEWALNESQKTKTETNQAGIHAKLHMEIDPQISRYWCQQHQWNVRRKRKEVYINKFQTKTNEER